MEKIAVESVPSYVQFFPRDQATLDHEIALAMAKFGKPGFEIASAGYFSAAIAARRNSAMPLSVEMWIFSRRDPRNGFNAQTSAKIPQGGASPMPPPIPSRVTKMAQAREMSREEAARHLSPAEFAQWDLEQMQQAKKRSS